MIEPNDYEMAKHIADLLMEGATDSDLRAIGYLTTDESRLCYAAAKERPVYW